MEIRAARKRIHEDVRVYDGKVDIRFAPLRITCQHAELSARDGRVLLIGSGAVTIRGLPGFGDRTAADRFRLHGDRGELVLAGGVHLGDRTAIRQCRLATVTLQGKVLGTRSLLDDFAESTDLDRRLALLDDLQAIYAEKELPPEVCYLAAMRLLSRHLSWHPALSEPFSGSRRGRGANRRRHGRSVAIGRGAHRASRGCTPVRRGANSGGSRIVAMWTWPMPFGCFAARRPTLRTSLRRRHWLADIPRNNTVLLLSGPASFRLGTRMEVALDVRNADRLSLRLYDGLGSVSEDALPDDAGVIYVWHADVADLKPCPPHGNRMPTRSPQVVGDAADPAGSRHGDRQAGPVSAGGPGQRSNGVHSAGGRVEWNRDLRPTAVAASEPPFGRGAFFLLGGENDEDLLGRLALELLHLLRDLFVDVEHLLLLRLAQTELLLGRGWPTRGPPRAGKRCCPAPWSARA